MDTKIVIQNQQFFYNFTRVLTNCLYTLERIDHYKELINQIKKGQKDAFRKLYDEYAPRIFQFALSYLKRETEAEELVQEVFIKIWEKKENLDDTKNLKSYIFKIAVNTIYQYIRRKNIENAYKDYIKNHVRSDDNNTWQNVIYNEMLDKLESILNELPEQQKRIFYLSKDKGLSNKEIAKKLNLSKRTVENHLYRAIFMIKKSLMLIFF